MKRWLVIPVLALSVLGCRSLKDEQRPLIVGDTQSKIYYKNVPDNEAKVPEARRQYFKSEDDAMGAGFANAQAAGGDTDKSD